MSSERLGLSQSERVSLKRLRTIGHEKILFLCNRLHQLPPRERERVKQYALRKLGPITELREEGIFFLDSLHALEARLNNDPALMDDSGMPLVEASLARFLTEERGRLKILLPAYRLKASIQEVRQVIPGQEEGIKGDWEAAEKAYREAEEPLRQLEAQAEFLRDVQDIIGEGSVIQELQSLQERFDEQVKDLRKEVESMRAAKREGETQIQEQLKNLASARKRVDEIDEKLDNFISQVAEV